MVVAGDVLVFREHPELVFPDQVVDSDQPCRVDTFEDVAEPFQPEKTYMLPEGESTRAA